MDADFKAFNQFLKIDWNSAPVVTKISASNPNSPFKHFLVINAEPLQNEDVSAFTKMPALSPQQKKMVTELRSALQEQIADNSARLHSFDTAIIQYGHAVMAQDKIDYYTNITLSPLYLAMRGGGAANSELGLFYFNHKLISLDDIIKNSTRTGQVGDGVDLATTSEKDNAYYADYLRKHEAAHGMLGLKEAGADFVAAALVLQKYPDAAKAMQIIADARNVDWLYENDQNLKQHGAECNDAIQHALNMSPADLKKMSVQDLYAVGKYFDGLTEKNALNLNSAEDIVLKTVSQPSAEEIKDRLSIYFSAAANGNKNADIFFDRIMESIIPGFAELQQKLDTIVFPKGSPEAVLADDMKASSDRLAAHAGSAVNPITSSATPATGPKPFGNILGGFGGL